MEQRVELKIDGVGIIEDSTIQLNGLTVITGHNNSGKTTTGKVLYAINSAVRDLKHQAEQDKRNFFISRLEKIRDEYSDVSNKNVSHFFQYALRYAVEIERRSVDNKKSLLYEYAHGQIPFASMDMYELIDYSREIQNCVYNSTDEEFQNDMGLKANEKYSKKTIADKKVRLVDAINKALNEINADPELTLYANKKIEEGLQKEFNYQILPVRHLDRVAEVMLKKDGERCFEIFIEDNRLIQKEKRSFFQECYEDALFIDNVFVLDQMADFRYNQILQNFKRMQSNDEQSWGDFSGYQNHNERLTSILTKKSNNAFEDILNQQSAKMVFERIDKIFPDEIAYSEDRYICTKSKLDIRNLATGSKMFAIIKLLMEKGALKKGMLLILDEPESHLHPEWQNKFAEIIVLLIKNLGIHVLLTTHSPNFLMAIELYSKQYEMWDATNIYCTAPTEKGDMIVYKNVNDHMQEAYKKLADPLFELNKLKLKLENAE